MYSSISFICKTCQQATGIYPAPVNKSMHATSKGYCQLCGKKDQDNDAVQKSIKALETILKRKNERDEDKQNEKRTRMESI